MDHPSNRISLRVSGKSDFVTPVTAAVDPAELPDFDLGIVATKATHVGIARFS